MKKLIIVLMVVAVTSFLFVGCLPGTTTPDTTTGTTTDTTTTPTTVAPIITGVADISGGYVNAVAAADGLVVAGTAPTYSEVKVYINGITAGTGDAGANGVFSVVVANADLIKAAKVEGAKTLHATATEAGLAESDSSNVMNFILDTVIPSIASSVAKAGTAAVYSFSETADTSGPGIVGSTLPKFTEVLVALPTTNPLLSGAINWKIEVMQVTTTDSRTVVRVYNLSAGTSLDYTYDNGPTTSVSWIPGLSVSATQFYPWVDIGSYVMITTTNTALSAGYVDVTFNEAVTGASIIGGAWTLFRATTVVANTPSVRSATVARLTETVAGTLTTGMFYSVGVSAIIDLAGNPIPATAPSSSSGVIIP